MIIVESKEVLILMQNLLQQQNEAQFLIVLAGVVWREGQSRRGFELQKQKFVTLFLLVLAV